MAPFLFGIGNVTAAVCGVRMVLVERLDRMARDLMIQEATTVGLERDGFTLASVQEPDLMASDPSAR